MKKNLLFLFCFTALSYYVTTAQSYQLIGTTTDGGALAGGTMFKINLDGSGFKTIYNFYDPAGWTPFDDLLMAGDNQIYGVCANGGDSASCTIYEHDQGNNYHKDLYSFGDIAGDAPAGGLVRGAGNILYGMTNTGGFYGLGVIYSFDLASNTYTDIHDFDSTAGLPMGSLLYDNGKLYGTTPFGGAGYYGILFGYDINSATYTVLFNFDAATGSPSGSLIKANDGSFYARTDRGGAHSDGILYRYTVAANKFEKLVDFNQNSYYLYSGFFSNSLMQASNGKIYGLAVDGGTNSLGLLFSYDIATNAYNDLFNFKRTTGAYPLTHLIDISGKLYGTTYSGGANDTGTVFSFDLTNNTYADLFDFNGTSGTNPACGLLKVTAPVGLPQISPAQFALYPNPMTNLLNISLDNNEPSEIIFYDHLARQVMRQPFQHSATINIQQLATGLYTYEIRNREGIIRKGKIQKVHP